MIGSSTPSSRASCLSSGAVVSPSTTCPIWPTASAGVASVTGGDKNKATGSFSTVSGGAEGEAHGSESSVTGGHNGNARGFASTVGGGLFELTEEEYGFVP